MGLGRHEVPEDAWQRITSKCDICDNITPSLKIQFPFKGLAVKYLIVCLDCIKKMVLREWNQEQKGKVS